MDQAADEATPGREDVQAGWVRDVTAYLGTS
jgi:hypothetical protein